MVRFCIIRHGAKRLLCGAFAMLGSVSFAHRCEAQLTPSRVASASATQVATLDEQLINRLRATTEERQAYVRLVVDKISTGEFDQRMVLAIERYAIRKNPQFPFPYFERAMRFEAEKRGIELPPVQLLVGAASTYMPRRDSR
jgi:hypothetical protein